MTPKRHSRTESISITKLSDLSDIDAAKTKQEFHMFVTEAEEIDRSFDKDEASDKISSESSREVEISDRKSSEGISDRISSEDAVTDKKTSSDEIVTKDEHVSEHKEKEFTQTVMDMEKGQQKIGSKTKIISKGKQKKYYFHIMCIYANKLDKIMHFYLII